jgi:glutamine synthetase adenylyltransferase
VVQLGILLNTENYPDLVDVTQINDQLNALQGCGWIKEDAFQALNNAYAQLSHARQEKALVDDFAEVDAVGFMAVAKPVCDDVLRSMPMRFLSGP